LYRAKHQEERQRALEASKPHRQNCRQFMWWLMVKKFIWILKKCVP
jgi:hypothetical protein